MFQGRTTALMASWAPPAALTIAPSERRGRRRLGVGGHEQLGGRTVDRLGLGQLEQRLGAARHRLNEQAGVDYEERVTRVGRRVGASLEQQAKPAGGADPGGGRAAGSCSGTGLRSVRRTTSTRLRWVRHQRRGRASKPDVMFAIASLPLKMSVACESVGENDDLEDVELPHAICDLAESPLALAPDCAQQGSTTSSSASIAHPFSRCPTSPSPTIVTKAYPGMQRFNRPTVRSGR